MVYDMQSDLFFEQRLLALTETKIQANRNKGTDDVHPRRHRETTTQQQIQTTTEKRNREESTRTVNGEHISGEREVAEASDSSNATYQEIAKAEGAWESGPPSEALQSLSTLWLGRQVHVKAFKYGFINVAKEALVLFRDMLSDVSRQNPIDTTMVCVLSACSQLRELYSEVCVHGFIKKTICRSENDIFIGTGLVDITVKLPSSSLYLPSATALQYQAST
ncbi:hypothetical protein GQ457_01G010520 [Hibiscus cannabinus]